MSEIIIDANIAEEYKKDMVDYAIEVNRRRSIPDYRDGLKLVQRRILSTMGFDETKAKTDLVKSARIVGSTMGKLHAHGDCIHGDTKIYSTNGNIYTIEQLYNSNVQSLEIIGINIYSGKKITSIAHSFRIGQYAKDIYHIELSNGFKISVTGNHPFMISCGNFIKAEELKCRYELKTFMYNKLDDNIDNLHIKSITVEALDEPIPMYDFTVDGIENMLIPAEDIISYKNNKVPFICIHNSSIYDAIKPMSNIFECQIPTIQNHGNFGSPQGDGAAHMRYTEVKLSKFSLDYILDEVLRCEEITNWLPNFDYTEKEPEYLPVKVPLLLINGSYGMGVGLMTSIPKHNPGEVIDETIKLIHDTTYEPILIPDNCMNCDIEAVNFKEMGLLGNGKFKVRARIDIETYKEAPYIGYQCLHIKSTPDRVLMNNEKDKIDELMAEGKLPQVIRYFDKKSPDGLNISFILILKKGSDPEYVKQFLYKHTNLQSTQTINFEIIDGIESKRSNYKDYLLSFLEFRMLMKIRYYSHLYKKAVTIAHEKETYVKLLESKEIENAMKYLKKQKTIDDNRDIEYLIKEYDITDLQAKFIINSSNKTQSIAYLNKYKEEVNRLHSEAESYKEKIMNENLLLKEIEEELLEFKSKYNFPRRCRVVDFNNESIPDGIFKVVVTNNNFIRKVLETDTVKCNRGGVASNPKLATKISNRDNIILFDNTGRVFKYPVHKIALCDKNTVGTDIRILMKKLTSEVIYIVPESVLIDISKKRTKHFVTVISEGNKIKKLDIEDILACNTSGIIYSKLSDGDRVKDVQIIPQNLEVIIYSGHKALRIDNSEIPHLKRNTMGNLAMNTDEPIEGISVIYPNTTYIVTITKNGKVNKIDASALKKSNRNLSGSSVIKLTKGDSIFAIYGVDSSSIIEVKTSDGAININVDELDTGSSISGGKKLISSTILKCIVFKK